MVKKISYQEAFKELESIINEIENGETGIDELSAKVKKAAELVKICKEKLRSTENEIDKILDDLDDNS